MDILPKYIQQLAAGSRFPPGNPVSPTNKSDRYDIAEILLKMASESHPTPYPPPSNRD